MISGNDTGEAEDMTAMIFNHPELLLQVYGQGVFPMAEERDGPVFWVDPDTRGVIPLDDFHVPKSLQKFMRKEPYEIKFDYDFEDVIRGCAAETEDRPETWINNQIAEAFITLHHKGHAHSVECWEGGRLVGGLYGLSIQGMFAGESMFSRAPNASKVALVHLVEHMKQCGMSLLDTQFMTGHLRQFGGMEIPRDEYRRKLSRALTQSEQWVPPLRHYHNR